MKLKLSADQCWQLLRNVRNKYLEETDKTQLADYPIETKTRGLYREYRQYLRNCPSMFNDENILTAKVKTFDEWREWKRNGDY